MTELEREFIADAIAAENVRRVLDGVLPGCPLRDTLARRVWSNTGRDM